MRIEDVAAERDLALREVAKMKRRLLAVGTVVATGSHEELAQQYAVLHDALCVLSIGHKETCACVACSALAAVGESLC